MLEKKDGVGESYIVWQEYIKIKDLRDSLKEVW